MLWGGVGGGGCTCTLMDETSGDTFSESMKWYFDTLLDIMLHRANVVNAKI